VSVTYTLTEAGRALLPALEQIRRWAERHLTTPGVGNLARPEPALRKAGGR
jgi:DNA-binding HxlR family transcriptional regulator